MNRRLSYRSNGKKQQHVQRYNVVDPRRDDVEIDTDFVRSSAMSAISAMRVAPGATPIGIHVSHADLQCEQRSRAQGASALNRSAKSSVLGGEQDPVDRWLTSTHRSSSDH